MSRLLFYKQEAEQEAEQKAKGNDDSYSWKLALIHK